MGRRAAAAGRPAGGAVGCGATATHRRPRWTGQRGWHDRTRPARRPTWRPTANRSHDPAGKEKRCFVVLCWRLKCSILNVLFFIFGQNKKVLFVASYHIIFSLYSEKCSRSSSYNTLLIAQMSWQVLLLHCILNFDPLGCWIYSLSVLLPSGHVAILLSRQKYSPRSPR